MATISQHIEQLKIDKQTLVDNLVEKGVEATSEETFTTLVPKVKDIEAGADLSEYFAETISNGNSSSVTGAGWSKSFLKLPSFINTGTSCAYMFSTCPVEIIDVSNFDTSQVTTMENFFGNCNNVKNIVGLENLNTSNVKTFTATFLNCYNLEQIDITKWDFSNATNISQLFSGCKTIEEIDISSIVNLEKTKIQNMNYIFDDCTNLKRIIGLEQLDFSALSYSNNYVRSFLAGTGIEEFDFTKFNLTKVGGFYEWFAGCKNLKTVNFNIDVSFLKATNSMYGLNYTFWDNPELENLTFCTNYGAGFATTLQANYDYASINLSSSPKLSHDSLMDVINKLYDLTANGKNTQKLKLGATNMAKLTEDEIAIATNKGWVVS